MPFYKNKKFWWIFAGSLTVALLIFGFFFLRAKVNITILPASDYEIIVDGKPYSAQMNKYFPGRHKILIEKPGFVTYDETQKFKVNQQVNLKIELKPVPDPIQISEGAASNLNLSPDRSSVHFIDKKRDRLVLYNPAGSARGDTRFRALSSEGSMAGVSKIIWSPDQNLAILKKDKTTGLYDFKRYDLVNQSFNSWGEGIGDLFWQPKNQKIFYYFAPAGGAKTLVQSNYAHTETNNYFDLGQEALTNPSFAISKSQDTLFIADNGGLWRFNIVDRQISRQVVDDSFVGVKISPNDKRVVGIKENQLVVTDLEGKNRKNFDVSIKPDHFTFISDDEAMVILNGILTKINLGNAKSEEFASSIDLSKVSELAVTADTKRVFFLQDAAAFTLPVVSKRY